MRATPCNTPEQRTLFNFRQKAPQPGAFSVGAVGPLPSRRRARVLAGYPFPRHKAEAGADAQSKRRTRISGIIYLWHKKGLISIDTEKRVNWHKIRAEYIGGVSQYKLAQKYHVSKDTVAKHCRKEGWTAERHRAKEEVAQKVIQKTAEKAADNATLAADIKRKGLLILDRLFDDFSQHTATEHRENKDGVVDVKRLRDLTAAYKDLTDDLPKDESGKNAPIYDLLRRLDNECGV